MKKNKINWNRCTVDFFLMKRGNGILSSTSKNYRYTSVRDWEKYQLRQLLFKY